MYDGAQGTTSAPSLLLRKGSQRPAGRRLPGCWAELTWRAGAGHGEGTGSHLPVPAVAVILEKPIRIPRFLSVKASHVLKGFLNKVRSWPPWQPSRPWLRPFLSYWGHGSTSWLAFLVSGVGVTLCVLP